MRSASRFRFLFTTVGDARHARLIARMLVSNRLAACVNVLAGVRSIYRWKGGIHEDREMLLIVKTTATNLARAERAIRKHHPYELPEIVTVRLDRGSEKYLRWIADETKKGR